MKKIVRLTESDLTHIVKRVINEAPITGQSGASNPTGTSKPVGAKAVNPGSVSKPKPNPVTSQSGTSKPKPNPVTGQSGTSGPNAMVNVNLVIDCKRRVIQKTDISLLRDANYMVINAFCTPSYRKPTGGK
jgi:hypothetical protein